MKAVRRPLWKGEKQEGNGIHKLLPGQMNQDDDSVHFEGEMGLDCHSHIVQRL
jgi:hypothetical protein